MRKLRAKDKFYFGKLSEKPIGLSRGSIFVAEDTGELFIYDSYGRAISSTGSFVYKANLTQYNTDNPIINVLENTTGLNITLTRTSPGSYDSNYFTGFINDNWLIKVTNKQYAADSKVITSVAVIHDGESDRSRFTILTEEDGIRGDGILTYTPLEITIYPPINPEYIAEPES